jgi:SAM-dependent methyltransferase
VSSVSRAKRSWDPVWDQVFSSQEWGKYPPEHVIRFVARNWYKAPDRKAIRLLDLGCGPGACTWYMAREGFSVSAIDGSAKAIELLQGRLSSEGLSADGRVGDYTELPWPEGTFDAVVENFTFCHNPFGNAKQAAQEVRRVLKPGGCFLSANFTNRSWGYGSGCAVEPGGFAGLTEGPCAGKGYCLLMSRKQVDELYRDFSEVSVETISWSAGNMAHTVESWVVTCRK